MGETGMRFHPGEWVVCVDASGRNHLTVGKQYKVLRLDNLHDEGCVRCDNDEELFRYNDRFRAIPPSPFQASVRSWIDAELGE
jgi:hypothetical protein